MSSRGVPSSSFPGNPSSPSGGSLGFAQVSCSPNEDIALGDSFTADSGWSLDDDIGTNGISIVSGQVNYEAGIYLTQLELQGSASADADTIHTVSVEDTAILGISQFLWKSATGFTVMLFGTYDLPVSFPGAVELSYLEGVGASIHWGSAALRIVRLGDVPV